MEWILTNREEGIETITLNRPEKLNAFFGTMREELRDAIEQAGAANDVRAVILTGAGDGFCAGGDVEFMRELQKEGDSARFRELLEAGAGVVKAIRSSSKPVIAAINGVAAGAGCNLALACDYRIAADHARLGETFVRIGLHPDWGGTWLLTRLVGPSRAMEIMMTGRMVEAAEALRLGMVDRVVAIDQLMVTATTLARAIAAGPPAPIADIKRAVEASERNTLENQFMLEAENQLKAFHSRDAAEGMAAFFEKRPPKFTGE